MIGGWLALRFGFAAAFAVMAASMIAAMLTLRTAPPVRLSEAPETDRHRTDWPRVILAITAVTLCFCAYEQLTNMVLLWAEQRVDLTLGGLTIPPSWLAAADGLFTITLALLAYRLWPRLSESRARRTNWPPGIAMALAYGLLAGLSGVRRSGFPVRSARCCCCRSASSCPGPPRWRSSPPPQPRPGAG
ncbi:hypothetical protein P0F65_14365 [Sphingomonas sp. I4]